MNLDFSFPEESLRSWSSKLFPRLHSARVVPAEQLLMQKFEVQRPNPDKPEITKYKHQITNKFQITISKSQTRSKTNCLEFWISVIVIWLVFVIYYLKFLLLTPDTWHLQSFTTCCQEKRTKGLSPSRCNTLCYLLNFTRNGTHDFTGQITIRPYGLCQTVGRGSVKIHTGMGSGFRR